MSEKSFGSLIDSLNIDPSIEDEDLVSGVVVLLKVVDVDGDIRFSFAWSDGLSFLERIGMLRQAEAIEVNQYQ